LFGKGGGSSKKTLARCAKKEKHARKKRKKLLEAIQTHVRGERNGKGKKKKKNVHEKGGGRVRIAGEKTFWRATEGKRRKSERIQNL